MEWRIFFIGPMRAGRDDGPADHFSQMVDAVAEELGLAGYTTPEQGTHTLTQGTAVDSLVLSRGADQVTLIQPHQLFAQRSISDNVFDAIDDADLVVADLSDVRPAVVYELALAHALGISTILLTSGQDWEPVFYFQDLRHVSVDFSQGSVRTDEFHTAMTRWLAERNKRFDSQNPFTRFYGAPIPDISAASGLAHGYYENFLSHVLGPGAQLVDRTGAEETRRSVSGVCVVKPESLSNLPTLVSRTGRDLEAAFGDRFRTGERNRVFVDVPEIRQQRTCEFVVDGWLVDLPRTVLTLARSPRLRRATGRADDAAQRAGTRLTEVLLERFLDSTRSAVGDDQRILEPERRYFYGDVSQVVDFLDAAPEARPSVWA